MGVQLAPRRTAPVEVEVASQRLRLGRLLPEVLRSMACRSIHRSLCRWNPLRFECSRSTQRGVRSCVEVKTTVGGHAVATDTWKAPASRVVVNELPAAYRSESSMATRLSWPAPCLGAAHRSVKKRQARASSPACERAFVECFLTTFLSGTLCIRLLGRIASPCTPLPQCFPVAGERHFVIAQ